MPMSISKVYSLVWRLGNQGPVRWFANTKRDGKGSHVAIEVYQPMGCSVPHRLISDMKAQGFTQMPVSELCGFMVYRFEAERSDIKWET